MPVSDQPGLEWIDLLQIARCLLVPPQPRDGHDLQRLYTDAEVRRYLGGPVDAQALPSRIQALLQQQTPHYWIIQRISDEAFIGSICLHQHNDGVSTELSYQLLPKWWGQGYATEAVQRVLHYAFTELQLVRMLAETQTANRASCRVLEKAGMHLAQRVQRFGAEQSIYCIEAPPLFSQSA